MTFQKCLFLGLTTAVFSTAGALVYAKFYNDTLFDYTKDLGYMTIASACVFTSVLAGVVYWGLQKLLKSWGEFVFNLVFMLGTFAMVPKVLEATVVSEIQEFYQAYALPLLFFPILMWMTLKPLFFRK